MDFVLFLPNLPYDSVDLADAYASADIFVLPSFYEPFGIVVLEAWAASCPVVCGRTGGLCDFGRDGENLRFTDPASSDALAGAVEELHQDKNLAAHLAQGGKETARTYSWETITGRLLELYDSE
mgnify:CR=1 FL=1